MGQRRLRTIKSAIPGGLPVHSQGAEDWRLGPIHKGKLSYSSSNAVEAMDQEILGLQSILQVITKYFLAHSCTHSTPCASTDHAQEYGDGIKNRFCLQHFLSLHLRCDEEMP